MTLLKWMNIFEEEEEGGGKLSLEEDQITLNNIILNFF